MIEWESWFFNSTKSFFSVVGIHERIFDVIGEFFVSSIIIHITRIEISCFHDSAEFFIGAIDEIEGIGVDSVFDLKVSITTVFKTVEGKNVGSGLVISVYSDNITVIPIVIPPNVILNGFA